MSDFFIFTPKMFLKLILFYSLRRINFALFIFYFFPINTLAQFYTSKNLGVNISVIASFGTHFQRFGIVFQGYGIYEKLQLNASLRLYHNYKNLGPKITYNEFNSSMGVLYAYGDEKDELNMFISPVSNQTNYTNAIAYSYNVWLNKNKTSQFTGTLALHFNRLSIISENDALAKKYLDRFRTGAILIQYQHQQYVYAISTIMWTGKLGSGVRDDSGFKGVGYLNLENHIYGNLSHGLLSAQISYVDEFSQVYQINVGVDADQVRNVMQNKLIHDMPFIPKKWNKAGNLHFPMIDAEGNQYLYKSKQKIRPIKWLINSGLNPSIFY